MVVSIKKLNYKHTKATRYLYGRFTTKVELQTHKSNKIFIQSFQ
jgi:hypothetical protein